MNRLRQLRERKGLTMKDTARALALPYTTYVNYEKGAREPGGDMLVKLADFFGTSVDYLLGKEDGAAPAPCQDESISVLNRAAQRMTPAQRQRLIDIAKVVFEDAFDE